MNHADHQPSLLRSFISMRAAPLSIVAMSLAMFAASVLIMASLGVRWQLEGVVYVLVVSVGSAIATAILTLPLVFLPATLAAHRLTNHWGPRWLFAAVSIVTVPVAFWVTSWLGLISDPAEVWRSFQTNPVAFLADWSWGHPVAFLRDWTISVPLLASYLAGGVVFSLGFARHQRLSIGG